MKRYILLWICSGVLLHVSGQQPGSLDQNFAGKGWATMPFGLAGNAYDETATQLLRQADGKYILSVYSFNAQFTVLARYNSNGTIDSSFGINGFSDPIDLDQSAFFEAKIAAFQMVNGDEKIVLAGIFKGTDESEDFGITRFNSNGTLDKTFGTGGRVTTDFFGDVDQPRAIAIQNYDNKILVAGAALNGYADFALARYNPDGSLDTDFGNGGKVTMDFYGEVDYANCIVVQTDHKIVLGGTTNNTGGSWDDFSLVRYDSNGALDTGFGSGGKVTTDFNGASTDMGEAMAIQTIDGADKIVVAGRTWTSTGWDFALAQYNPDGSLDASFDTDGKVTTSFGISSDEAFAVAIQPDHKIILAGGAYVGSDDFGLARYNIDGSLDTGFGTNGLVAFRLDVYSANANAILLDGENIMVAGGTRNYSGGYDFALVCLNSVGGLVSNFGTGGAAIGYYESYANSFVKAVAIQNVNGENKILLAGSSNNLFAVARYNADGSTDKSFGVDGKVFNYFSGPCEAWTIAVQNINGEDKIVVAGVTEDWEDGDSSSVIARYNADGSPDESFGYLGTVTWGSTLGATSMAIQADNKILIAGQIPVYDTATYSLDYDFGIFRYKIDGMPDSTFGVDGFVITDFLGHADSATSIAIQTDGKIIVAGKAVNANGSSDFAMARYLINGTLDAGFGNRGKLITDFETGNDIATVVAVQTDGKILVAGIETTNAGGNNDQNFAIARYTTKGKLDITFGSSGKIITDFNTHNDAAYTLALQADGKILVAGSTATDQPGSGFQNDFALACYTPTGVLDLSFGTANTGKVVSDLGFSEVISASLLKNDRLYVAGTACNVAGFTRPTFTGIAAAYITSAATLPLVKINDVTVSEGDTARLTVSVDRVSSTSIAINYATQDVTTVSKGKNADYKAAKGVVLIPAGQTSGEIKVVTYGDNQTLENSETFNVNLSLTNQSAGLASMAMASAL